MWGISYTPLVISTEVLPLSAGGWSGEISNYPEITTQLRPTDFVPLGVALWDLLGIIKNTVLQHTRKRESTLLPNHLQI